MIDRIRKLLELIRFSHTLFALPFAMTSAALAWKVEPFRWLDLVGILLCMVTARSTAMAFNRLVDRRFDAANPRTLGRHLPAGSLSLGTVVAFTLITSLLFVASTSIFYLREPSNPWPMILALPVLGVLLGYSLTKRFTALAHFWLGFSLMLAPIAAWIAIRGLIDMETPIILGVAVLFWVSGFDIIYACQDCDFDRNAGLHSVPARLGVRNSLRLAAILHAVMAVLLVVLGVISPHLDWLYFVAVGLVMVLLIVEHRLVKPEDLSRVNASFFQVNAVISIGLFVVVVIQLAIR